MPDYTYCDYDALHAEDTKASSLTPNQFQKLCPGAHGSSTFGQPRCGDGTNFSFMFSRPLQQLSNDRKILIEFQGGGACWDEETCGMQEDYLTFPEMYDSFVGMSCSEIEYGATVNGEYPLSLLCAKKVGNTDFRHYNTIVVPYCTQDIHLGDAPNVSYDGENTIQHVGAHNMVRTLKWVFSNFPNPTHIFLTGCSAGGTAVPIAYDLINKHYNKFGPRAVNINVLMDSSVYLTPSYFLQNGFPNWNPETIMKTRLGFNYNKYKYQENYPDLVWNHVLKRGSNFDQWGFITHSTDPISLMFYQYMSGNGDGEGGRSLSLTNPMSNEDDGSTFPVVGHETHGRRMDNDDLQSQWWTEISSSLAYATENHRNIDYYVIDGEGHCSFGLYYALQEEGFEEWASPIVKEGVVIGNRRPSVASFIVSAMLGGLLIFLTLHKKRVQNKNGSLIEDKTDLSYMGETAATAAKRVNLGFFIGRMTDAASPILAKCQSWPWTAGYLLMITIYFVSMLVSQGFAHPLDNPAFGPSAVGLSTFGINNPSLIIYRMEYFRLITSSFLCSGVTTYLLTAYTMYKTSLEAAMTENNHPHWHILLAAVTISFGTNLLYACIGNGASCSSLALAIGLNIFSVTMQRRSSSSYPSPLCFTIFFLIVASTPLFPFDSVVALASAVVIGLIIGLTLFIEEAGNTFESGDDYNNEVQSSEESTKKPTHLVQGKIVQKMGVVYFIMNILLMFRVPSPNKEHAYYPYLTGCSLVYSDQISDLVNAYASGNGGRALEGNDGEDMFDGQNMCAQMCIPHLVYRPALWGVQKFALLPVEKGTCEENGYDEHVADHTIREFTVTLEVMLFTASNEENDG